MHLDPNVFPRASDYLRNLPDGLASYPQCRVKGDVHEDTARDFPALREQAMPPPIEAVMRNPSGWVSEVASTSLGLMVRDLAFQSDEAYRDWNRERIRKVFARPTYKMLMYVMSPSLVVMGAARRWEAFREGSSLIAYPSKKDPSGARRSARLELVAPAGLFPPLALLAIGDAFVAALEAANARDLRAERPLQEGKHTVYQLSWAA